MKHLDLIDTAEVSGTDMNELLEVLTDIDQRRKYVVIRPDELKFFVLDNYTSISSTGVMVPPVSVDSNNRRYDRRYIPHRILDLPPALLEESVATGAFFVGSDGNMFPVSMNAFEDLQARIGLRGSGTEAKTPLLLEYICETAKNRLDQLRYDPSSCTFEVVPNGKSQKEKYVGKNKTEPADKYFGFTVVYLCDHDNSNIQKVFSFRSEKYASIPQKSIILCIDGMQMMGTPVLHRWKVSHFFTEADVTFPAVAEAFSNVFSCKDKVIPCFRINTSDTGRSSLRISKYLVLERSGEEIALRLPKSERESTYELTRHFGSTDIQNLISKINTNLFDTFKSVPEKMQMLFGLESAPVKETLEVAFAAMKLQDHAGVIISKDLQDKIIEQLVSLLPHTQRIIDTVYAALFAADEESLNISDNQREELRNNALLALWPVDKYQELEIKQGVKQAV